MIFLLWNRGAGAGVVIAASGKFNATLQQPQKFTATLAPRAGPAALKTAEGTLPLTRRKP